MVRSFSFDFCVLKEIAIQIVSALISTTTLLHITLCAAEFCQQVSDNGLIFIGPPPDAITAMGSKSKSKAIMEAAGVPTTPGYYGDDTQEPEVLLAEANKVGYPLLIKAVSGGGGKGMRLVWKESEFLDNLASCQREAQSSFGDKRVLLERYLVSPRHVEVQVVADQYGNVVHLFERDCSLQRRHQKIIEEAPASDLPLEFRHEIGEMGKRAAQAVGYVNAGTVEFLLDTQGPEPSTPMFCEMNTRLQVEHPITELVTGVDLVEWQLRIAAGEELPKQQSDIICSGHAFEARIYAENPARNFLPATGTVWHHQPPADLNVGINDEGVRVDTGIEAGSEVGVYYDPMICKLIVYDQTRDKALDKLVSSLKNYQIAGVPTNIDFLVNCAEHATFQKAGAINTGFLDHHLDEVQVPEDKPPSPLAAAVGAFSMLLHLEGRHQVKDLQQARRKSSPWSSLSGSWTMGGRARRVIRMKDGSEMECFSNRDGSFDIHLSGETFNVQGAFNDDRTMRVVVNGKNRLELTAVLNESEGVFEIRMWPKGAHGKIEYFWEVDIENPMMPPSLLSSQAVGTEGSVKAPMPGKISRINFSPGDEVKEGDVLLVMEAMKMEHAIKSPISGILAELRCQVDDIVKDSSMLATVVSAEEDGAPSEAA
jgi:3-methylcrotonyl-CoA carboxylase alpha subunit